MHYIWIPGWILVDLAEQLEEHVRWIKAHHTQAQEMAFACHEIFSKHYSLEILLRDLVNDVQSFRKDNRFNYSEKVPPVEIIVRSDGKQQGRLFRALASIHAQTYPRVMANIIFRGKYDDLQELKKKVQQTFPALEVIYTPSVEKTDRATQFYSGLRSTTAPYIGYLDHDDILFRDHVTVLMSILQHDQDAGVVYGGSVRVWEEGEPPGKDNVRNLAYFHDFDSFKEKAYITSNSYLVRREKIPWHIMNQPIPSMDCREDRLFLKLLDRDRVKFVFSEKVTSAFFCRVSKQDHSNENDDVLEQGKRASEFIQRSATSPWRHTDNALPHREIVTLELLKKLLSVIKNDFHQVSHHLKNLLKK